MQLESTKPHEPLTFLALGDSYTIGEGVIPAERWPVQLAIQLRKQGVNIADPRIIATTGWTTDELANGIERAKITEHYDLVSLLIGVNNQYRGRDLEEYRQQFRSLLQQAIEFAGNRPGHVLVLSIPDWGVTPFAGGRNQEQVSREIAQFNTVNQEESQRAGVHYVNITPASQLAKDDLTLLADDQLHPSGKMYSLWVDLARPIAEQIFREEAVK